MLGGVMLSVVMPTLHYTKNPAFYVAAGLRHKSDFAGGPGVPSAFRSMYNELAVRGVLINEAIFDGGGELTLKTCY